MCCACAMSDRPRKAMVNGVRVISLPGSLGRSNKIRYAFDYAAFCVLVALTLAFRQLRRRYSVVQVYTMPDFLVFAAPCRNSSAAASSRT